MGNNRIGTEQWTRGARDNPKALYDAQVDWHARNIVVPMQQGLLASGVRPEIANDPRVLNYLADRRVQHGNVGWAEAMQLAQGARSPEEYIAAVSANDRANVGTYFRSYLRDHPNDVHGLQNRIALRERLSLDPTAYGNEFSLIEGDRSAAFEFFLTPRRGTLDVSPGPAYPSNRVANQWSIHHALLVCHRCCRK